MTLVKYRKKRDFKKTPEPSGSEPKRSSLSSLSFAIQKHDASHLHYDLRLEMNGVLKSWAVPKGPSLDPAERRLAVEVEDHPLQYGGIEGTIPKGQYGGGTVLLWDRGTWNLIDQRQDPDAAYRAGKIKFVLHGEKLRGGWTLVRMREAGPKANWLLIKEKDDQAKDGAAAEVTGTLVRSVKSDRKIEEIAGGKSSKPTERPAKSSSRRAVKAKSDTHPRGRKSDVDIPTGARKAPFPHSHSPQLCTLATEIPQGDQWRHEVKFDGYRMTAFVGEGNPRLLTRAGHDWSEKFPEVIDALRHLKTSAAVLDGELVSLDDRGLSHFQGLQAAIKAGTTRNLVLFVFDLVHLEGFDLKPCALDDRYRTLAALLKQSHSPELVRRVRLSEHIDGSGTQVLRHACRLHLEGIVSKRGDSTYDGVRSSDWLKTKCGNRQEFVVAGYTDPKRSRSGFGALVLGYYDDSGKLIHAGKVGSGFDETLLKDIYAKLQRLEVAKSPFATALTGIAARGAHWVRPKLVAEIAFTQWTSDGLLRHPVFAGLRSDKDAADVVRESPEPKPRGAVRRRVPDEVERDELESGGSVLGVAISHPDRVVYPEPRITKLQIAQYYAAVSDHIMPLVSGRPLSLVRCPRGPGGACFFNKHLDTEGLKGLEEIPIVESKGRKMYVVVVAPAGLISLAQMNTLELHGWGSPARDVEHADRLVFDLDPGEGVEWKDVVTAARRMREMLEGSKLASFVKTTGGKGLHVVAPIRPTAEWDTVKAYCRMLAEQMQSSWPDEYVATASKAKRVEKVFVDYLRNQRGATSVVTYSSRARADAGVSMPIAWDQLGRVKPGAFTILTVPKLLSKRAADPWNGYADIRQSLPKFKIPQS